MKQADEQTGYERRHPEIESSNAGCNFTASAIIITIITSISITQRRQNAITEARE